MTLPEQELNLTGKMLIAMPGMGDPRFSTSVIFICAHSSEGAMGLIINKPMHNMHLSNLLEQLSVMQSPGIDDINLYFGGPVEGGRGFVLHSTDYTSDLSTLSVSPDFGMTATVDILEDMAKGSGPRNALVALGYSGWGEGQLEAEISANGWLICDATRDMVFGVQDADKWTAALNSLGVDPLTLSLEAGHA